MRAFQHLVVAGCFLGLSACLGLDKQEGAADSKTGGAVRKFSVGLASEANAKSLPVFQRTVYPLLRRDCASCHGANQAPKFAVEDVFASHALALAYVDFKNIPGSAYVKRTKDGHCRLVGCSTDGALMTSAINAWKKGRDIAGPETGEGAGLPKVQWKVATQVLDETESKISVTLENEFSPEELKISFQISGTATEGSDFAPIPVASRTLIIPPFRMETTFEVSLLDDLTYEGSEDLVFTLVNPVGARIGERSVHIVSLLDNDPAPVAQWELAAQSVAESTLMPVIKVILSNSAKTDIVLPFTLSGTAAATDYVLAGTTSITIPAGATYASLPLSLVDDALDEDDETLVVTLGTPTGAVLGANRIHTLTITDNDAAPSVQFSGLAPLLTESNTTAKVTVSLSAVNGRAVTVPFTVGGTASFGSDHNLANGQIIIPAGSPSADISIPLLDDNVSEGTETLILTLGSPTNASLGATTVRNLTLLDDEAMPRINFAAASQTVQEAAGSVTVVVNLSGALASAVTVPYTIGGTAANPGDHNAAGGSVTFAAGSTSANIVFNVVNDTRDENDETVIIALGTPSSGAIAGATNVHTVTLVDDDAAPSVGWTTASQKVSETAGAVSVSVSVSAVSEKVIQVPYTVSGTASRPADHNLANGMITVPALASGATVSFSVVNDAVVESDETIVITLGSPTNATLGTIATHTVTITEQAVPVTAQLSTDALTISEGAGTASFTVQLNSASASAITVPYTVSGTASRPGDHSLANGNLTIPAGQTSGSVSFSVVDDLTDEPDETIVATLGAPTGASLGSRSVQTITLTDNDAPSVVGFTQASRSIAESIGTAMIQIALDRASAFAVSVPFVVSGTASNPLDHDLANGTITIPAGSTVGSVSLNVVNDTLDEDNETLIVTLQAPTNATLGAIAVQNIDITDDDLPSQVRFAQAARSVSESVGAVTVQVELDKASGQNISVAYAVSGTASNPADHNLAGGTFSIPAGATSASVTMNVVNDTLDENDETVIVTLSNPVNASLGTSVQTITIVDDDIAPVLSWSAASQTVMENAGAITLTATLNRASAKAVSASITLGGTANSPADYQLSSATLNIPAGSTTGSTILTVIDDALNENAETIILTLANPVNATLGTATHTITLNDNDPAPSVRWELISQTVSENVGSALIKAVLSMASGKTITIPYAVGGTASPGNDFILADGTLTVAAGSTGTTLVVPIVNDTIPEPSDKTLMLTIGPPTNATVGSPDLHTLTIADNDVAGDPKIESFRNSVYVITRRDCTSCHTLSVAPYHASSDLSLAYSMAKPKANFVNVPASVFITKVKDGHCGIKCQTNGNEMQTAITTWAAAENAGSPNPTPSPAPGGSNFACASADAQRDSSVALNRLTGTELSNTYQSLLPANIWQSLLAYTYLLPPDKLNGQISNFNNAYTTDLVDQVPRFNEQVATLLTANDAAVRSFFGSCASTSSFTQTCFNTFMGSVGPRIFRSAVTATDRTDLWALVSQGTNVPTQLNILAQTLFDDPRFLYHIELGSGTPDASGRVLLSSYEVASRISYGMTASPPDSALWADAVTNSLQSLTAVTNHVNRIALTATFQRRVTDFVKFYIGTETAKIPSTLPAFLSGLDITGYSAEATNEFDRFVQYIIFEQSGKLTDLFTSDAAFPRSSALAQVFETSQWTVGTPPLRSPHHRGILTKPYVLLVGDANTKPVQRGRLIRMNMLCSEVPQPSAEDLAARPMLTPSDLVTLPRRQYVDKATNLANPASACAGCHSKMNPLGFASGNFDSIGRYAIGERIFDSQNALVASFAFVNTSIVPAIVANDPTSAQGIEELQISLAGSDTLQQCFVNKTFEFFQRRPGNPVQDGCRLNQMDNANKTGQPLLQSLLFNFTQPSILYKRSN